MALHLSGIFGTEKDKVNCPFYFKIGACRHGEKCSRIHHRPAFSQTILLAHMYQHPVETDEKKRQQHFEEFYEDVFGELEKYGTIEELNVCDNLAEHLIGNVYAKYKFEEDASTSVESLTGRFYSGRLLIAELSPVTDFREACCRQFETGECSRGGHCNFLHLKEINRDLRKRLFRRQSPRRSKSTKDVTPAAGPNGTPTAPSNHRHRSRSPERHGGTHHGHRSKRSHSHSHSPSKRRGEKRERSRDKEHSKSPKRRRERSRSPERTSSTTAVTGTNPNGATSKTGDDKYLTSELSNTNTTAGQITNGSQAVETVSTTGSLASGDGFVMKSAEYLLRQQQELEAADSYDNNNNTNIKEYDE